MEYEDYITITRHAIAILLQIGPDRKIQAIKELKQWHRDSVAFDDYLSLATAKMVVENAQKVIEDNERLARQNHLMWAQSQHPIN